MRNLILWLLVFSQSHMHAQTTELGKLDVHQDMKTPLGHTIPFWVWTSSNYIAQQPAQVMYILDGKMLFDAQVTWNNLEWTVDETIETLIGEHIFGPTIVIGISYADSMRHNQYTPEKPFRAMTQEQQNIALNSKRSNGSKYYLKEGVCSDDWLHFLVKDVKPFVEDRYGVQTTAANTWIGGASMGGLMAVYALLEYPQIFGACFALSTNWPLTEAALDPGFIVHWIKYTEQRIPLLSNHFLYMDYGDIGKDATYASYQTQMDNCLRKNGFNFFETKIYRGHDHSEASWARRLKDVFLRLHLR
jgi:enterochelin esterase-like enzyme